MLVYIVRHRHYGTSYIGKTKHDIDWRWKYHVSQSGPNASSVLGRAINKYGPDAFEKEIICTGSSEEELNELEKLCIAAFQTRVPKGYNLTDGGDGVIGLVFTPAIRKKLREAALRNNSAQYLPHTGFQGPHSPETRKKLSEANKRRPPASPETREKLRQAHLGRQKSEAELVHIRAAMQRRKGVPMNEETKKKISITKMGTPAWNKGTPHTEAHRQKLREAWVKRKQNAISNQ